MGSTNKTTNYELSQYLGTDKPTYLGDYNSDMQKIDTRMKINADGFASAQSLAQSAKDIADLAEEHAQTGITNAGTAQSTATSALTKAIQNESDIAKLNMTRFQTYNTTDVQITGASIVNGSMNVASNADGSVGKIYGSFTVNDATSETPTVVLPNSNLRPSEDIVINGIATNYILINGQIWNAYVRSVTIRTNGNIELNFNETIGGSSKMIVTACLLFMTDFGDTPQTP